MSVESVMLSNHLILCCPLLIWPSLFPSIRIFSNELALHVRWPKYGSFSFSISHYNEYSGLISFRIDWSDLLAVQGTLKNLLQHHNSKASVLLYSVFFMVQLSHPYMTPGRTIALTIWTFVSKVMSLLFNTLSRFVIAFLPRSKHLLISWLQSQSAVILEPKKIKSVTISVLSPSICHEMMGPSHPYMATGKTIALTRQTFVGKVMSLLFNMLSRLDIAFLSRSKCLLISWLQSPSAVILEPPKIKSVTVSSVSPSISQEVMGPDAMIFVF